MYTHIYIHMYTVIYVYSFNNYIYLCNHHQNLDAEYFHHFKKFPLDLLQSVFSYFWSRAEVRFIFFHFVLPLKFYAHKNYIVSLFFWSAFFFLGIKHVILSIKSSFHFYCKVHSTEWTYHNVLIHFSIYRHLDGFQFYYEQSCYEHPCNSVCVDTFSFFMGKHLQWVHV